MGGNKTLRCRHVDCPGNKGRPGQPWVGTLGDMRRKHLQHCPCPTDFKTTFCFNEVCVELAREAHDKATEMAKDNEAVDGMVALANGVCKVRPCLDMYPPLLTVPRDMPLAAGVVCGLALVRADLWLSHQHQRRMAGGLHR